MLPAASAKIADKLWLAANDRNQARIATKPLGLGLAAGLIGELIVTRNLTLRGTTFARRDDSYSHDPALSRLLQRMQEHEQAEAAKQPAPEQHDLATRPARQAAHAAVQRSAHVPRPAAPDRDFAPAGRGGPHPWPPLPAPSYLGRGVVAPQPAPLAADVQQASSREHVHDLGMWLAYLAQGPAEAWIHDRLAHAALAHPEQKHRFLRGDTTVWVPRDSVVSGTPATTIVTAIQRQGTLPVEDLLLAGLMQAIGLHHQRLASLTSRERDALRRQIASGVDGLDTTNPEVSKKNHRGPMLQELLQAAKAAVGKAAILRR